MSYLNESEVESDVEWANKISNSATENTHEGNYFLLFLEDKSFKTNYFKTNDTFSIDFCELALFSLVGSEVVICLAIMVLYHPWERVQLFNNTTGQSIGLIAA